MAPVSKSALNLVAPTEMSTWGHAMGVWGLNKDKTMLVKKEERVAGCLVRAGLSEEFFGDPPKAPGSLNDPKLRCRHHLGVSISQLQPHWFAAYEAVGLEEWPGFRLPCPGRID